MKRKFVRCNWKRFSSSIMSIALCAGLFFNNAGGLQVSAETVSGNDSGQEVTEPLPTVSAGDVSQNDLVDTFNFMSARATGLSDTAKLALAGKTTENMTIDGSLTEGVWSQAEANSIEYLADFTINNNSSDFKTTWDDNKLYIGVTVKDALVVTDQNGKWQDGIYNNDGIEIFLDGNNSKAGWDKDDFHIFIRNDGLLDVWGGTKGKWSSTTELDGKLECAVVYTQEGFNVEVAVDLNALGVIPGDGTVLGLGVTNNDNDNLTSNGRKEITWNPGNSAADTATWGVMCLYDTRKPVVSTYGTPNMKNGVSNWEPSVWNFSDEYSLDFTSIADAKLKFSSLSDYEAFYLGMVIESKDASANPFVEAFISGDNKRTGTAQQDYGYILQWAATAKEAWQQLNITAGKVNGTSISKEGIVATKYNLGNGSYAAIVKIPWIRLTPSDGDTEIIRDNYSVMSFSIGAATATMTPKPEGNGETISDNKDFNRWTSSQPWWSGSEPMKNAASIIMNNPNMIPMDTNVAPEGAPYFAYSIPQGGSVSGKVKVTDANQGDVLTHSLEEGFDTAYGTVTVDSTTGGWTYEAPNASFVTARGDAGVSFWIVTTDSTGKSFRTRIEVKVEYAPTNLTYYVDGDTGNDNNDGLSYENALRTINAAHDKTKPGDTVLIYSSKVPYGWYTEEQYAADENLYASVRNGAIVITHSGLPDHPITYRAADGEKPIVKGNGIWDTFVISANYIIVDGLTVQGRSDEITYQDAYKAFWGKMADKSDTENYNGDWNYSMGLYNTNGITVGPVKGHGMGDAIEPNNGIKDANVSIPHHITIQNCTTEYLAGSGIGGSECDYVTIDNCTAINNCWWGMYGNSGLGFITLVDIDDNTDYKIIIRDSISAGNRHFIPWKAGTVRLSDGNGIIMDTCDEHGHNYQGKTLITNNLVYENGGSGIHSFRADNVDMINNTVFNNNATPELDWGEMFSNDSLNVRMYNNIVYSRTGCKENPAASAYNNNIFFNYNSSSAVETAASGAANQFGVDPLFTSAIAVNHMPEGFDTSKDYPEDWYIEKTAAAGINPKKWISAQNAASAGWYPDADYDVKTFGYNFTLKAESPALGAADMDWQTVAGGEAYANTIGVFSQVGAPLVEENPDPSEPPSVDPSEPPSVDPSEPPSVDPSEPPSVDPSEPPSVDPSEPPSVDPDVPPSVDPELPPSVDPDVPPSVGPSVSLTQKPSAEVNWNQITADLSSAVKTTKNTQNGRTVNAVVGNNIAVPEKVFDTLRGSDVVLALHTGHNLTFSISGADIRGKAVTKKIDLSVSNSRISAPAAVVNEKLKGTITSRQIVTASQVSYGMTVNMHVNLGTVNAGNYMNLYSYNAKTGKLEYNGSFQITKSGAAMFGITQGGEYLITVTKDKPREKGKTSVFRSYTVRTGDTLDRIAAKNGITVTQLLEANPDIKNPNRIRAGQNINLN